MIVYLFASLFALASLAAAPATKPSKPASTKPSSTTKPATTKPTSKPTTKPSRAPSLPKMTKFSDDEHGFGFEVPYDWDRREKKSKEKKEHNSEEDGQLDWVIFEEPRRGPDDRFRESFAVSEQRPHGEIEVKRVSKEWEDAFKQHYPDWKYVSKTDITIDGATGQKTVGLFHVTDVELTGELIILKKGDHLIAVECFTRSGLYTRYRTIFNAILNSLKISE